MAKEQKNMAARAVVQRGAYSGLPLPSAKAWFFICLYTCFFIYFVFHIFNGERGLYALLKENRKFEVLSTELERVQTERANLERDVKLMRSESLDLDMLDEQVRSNLGLAGVDEVMVLQPE
jgi:cell division protein FtsB